MEGDFSSDREMGIIPRTLVHLFDRLEKETVEFSVRISYLEIYNEELKDLLSPEDDFRKLRTYDDLNRKGSVVVQGLEELLVTNAQDVFKILEKGSTKRQIAATKMNQNSSRSHAIFSITVHIKENTPDGEELLKVGKLNLVDLAGSENIGRSGAVTKRAKEAGMINQSLLTLGRVINALVEHSPHIPYRESKLTRILQDSLGGRTKTCIIAAVSPAKCSIEETLSTLDYAHRAKNIRNKPEVNQKMTKRALIKDYVNQIELLKADLTATREKNGIYLSAESYNSLKSEIQGNKTSVDEMTKLLSSRKEEIEELENKFRLQSDKMTEVETKLMEAAEEINAKQRNIDELNQNVEILRKFLTEQEVLTAAHEKSEEELATVASELAGHVQTGNQEILGLYEKIGLKF